MFLLNSLKSKKVPSSLQMKDLQIYEAYCQNKPRSESLWRQCSDCAFFQVAPLTFCFQL